MILFMVVRFWNPTDIHCDVCYLSLQSPNKVTAQKRFCFISMFRIVVYLSDYFIFKVSLHLTSPSPHMPSFNIVPIVTDTLMGKLGSTPIVSINKLINTVMLMLMVRVNEALHNIVHLSLIINIKDTASTGKALLGILCEYQWIF